ncbi:MAG: hypothetical protein H6766_06315 [Candidatus Peribacteria bacterium]|nr:MAG: hypothetical protein H6766_06315 [Candidatus Peribacteria bacterium]
MSQTDEQLAQTVKLFAAKQNWDDAYREHFDKNYLTFLQRIRDRKNYDQRPQLYTIMRTIQDT